MYPLNLKTKCSKTTYTFTWIIEDKNDVMPQSQSGPTFKVNSEKWHLDFHKFSRQYGFRLYRRVSGSDVLVNATIEAVNAKGQLIGATFQQLNYDKTEATDANFALLICVSDFQDDHLDTAKYSFAWKDLSEADEYPNIIKFKLNLEFCVLVTSVEGVFTNEELQKQAQISLAKFALDMFDNQTNIDVTFSVRSEWTSGHKLILAARSPVIARMLRAEFTRRTIEINHMPFGEIPPQIMKILFEFLYTRVRYDYSDIDYRGEKTAHLTLLSLYNASYHYEVRDLKKLVNILALREITPHRVGALLDFSDNYSDHKLKCVVLQFIKDNFKACCREDFLNWTGGENSPFYKQIILNFD